MLPILKKFCIFAFLITAPLILLAQTKLDEREIGNALLKKDLKQAIKEAESSASNDPRSFATRLSLYQRAANGEKLMSTVRAMIATSVSAETPYSISQPLISAIKDPLFTDSEALHQYLKIRFDTEVFGRFVELCFQDRKTCDVVGFDNLLEQKVEEAFNGKIAVHDVYNENNQSEWLQRRIAWRERAGLDNGEIFSGLAEEVRKNPSEMASAWIFVNSVHSVPNLTWLADTFVSESAFDNYELGERILNGSSHWKLSADERGQVYEIAARFLLKSLSLPFSKTDTTRMYSRKFRYVSVPVEVKNPEKQIRFWAKSELAEAYKKMGRPQDAQPIVEELMSLDTSDIVSYLPSRLAGQVQAASGMRAVESKILVDQATRQTSFEYWWERILYFEGRDEPERVFDSYLKSFAAVPFNISDERSRGNRLHYIDRFTEILKENFEEYLDDDPKFQSEDEKRKRTLWHEGESFLRDEVDRTKTALSYSISLAGIVIDGRFRQLTDEILTQNRDLLINAAKSDLLNRSDDILRTFFESETIPQSRKDATFAALLKVAESKSFKKAWVVCDALNGSGGQDYAARIVPILEKNLNLVAFKLSSTKISSEGHGKFEDIKRKYVEILFDTYLAANDWKSAEKLLMQESSLLYDSPIDHIMFVAARNGAFADAVRLWKMKANLYRRNLEGLDSLKLFPPVAEGLRSFYQQMKLDEPYSPVPNLALNILK